MNFHGSIPAAIFGFVIICVVLLDAFETVVLPRRVTRHFKLTAWFYRRTWIPWKNIASRIRTTFAAAKFSGILRAAVADHAAGVLGRDLILGFALVQYGIGGHEQLSHEPITFGRIIYHSGQTFFTLGYGDILPTSSLARSLSVLEAGMGFAFLGVVIGYLPVVYASFSRREIQISMLDARAGSPPTATELLVRLAGSSENPAIDQVVLDGCLRDWERWAGELLESGISYPVLSFFRSQHSNQSWLGALLTMLDVTSLVITGIEGIHPGAGAADFCHGAACGRGSGAGGECALRSAGGGTAAGRRFRHTARSAGGRGIEIA
jgi:hypothetical protein